jgi:glycosyltransferase involved in cell wall biosynthesis
MRAAGEGLARAPGDGDHRSTAYRRRDTSTATTGPSHARRAVACQEVEVAVGRLRVGLVCGHFDPARDGVADYTRHLAQHLRSAGCEALICTAYRYARTPGAEIVGVTDRWDAAGVLRAARALGQMPLDVVHVQFAPSAFGFSRSVGLLPLLLPAGTSVLATVHEYGVRVMDGVGGRLRSALWSAMERQGWADRETLVLTVKAARLLVTAPEHADVVNARFAHRGLEVIYVPIAPNIPLASVDGEDIPSAVRASLGLPPDALLAVFFGFLHPVKGLERLIEAVAAVRRVLPGLRLVLAGGGESHSVPEGAAVAMRRGLEDAARRHGLEHEVIFTGYLREGDVSRLLRAADAAVFPFDAGVTAKSGSLLAAMAHGVPTIATSRPGELDQPTEVHGVLRVPPRNTAALADALRLVLSDRALATRLAAAGRTCAARWTWSDIAGFHARMYAEVLREADSEASQRLRPGVATGTRISRAGRKGR